MTCLMANLKISTYPLYNVYVMMYSCMVDIRCCFLSGELQVRLDLCYVPLFTPFPVSGELHVPLDVRHV